jgi:hypothetical protein
VRAAIAAGAGAFILAIVGVGAYGYEGKPRLGAVSPAHGALLAERTPRISVAVSHAARLDSFRISIDGRDVTGEARREAPGIVLRAPPLRDGPHRVVLVGRSSGLFGGSESEAWTFATDTRPPTLALRRLPHAWIRTPTVVLAGRTEPGVQVSALAGAATGSARANRSGGFSIPLAPGDGRIALRVTATDPAGNERRLTRALHVDATPPRVRFRLERVVRSSLPVVAVRVHDLTPVRTRALLDGETRVRLAVRPEQPLDEGRHRLSVVARDAAGNVTRRTLRFVVDSTERLGQATLALGARGRDVAALQRRLREQGFWHGRPTGRYARSTFRAVSRFQEENGIPVDGVAGPYTIGALSGHIVIDQSLHLLTLFRDGQPPVSFGVALGQPAYPTPNGHFYIVNMVRNPTWVPPPDAPWAKGALPIPPGPDNPLGTRWMGLSAPNVGMHGTNDPASIGFSVSHGCIRMQVPDAERLFDMVAIGMSVFIQP